MKSTALGAENIIFISDAHEKFYYEKLQEVRYQDVYHKALCYCLGINGDTRKNADRIYNFKTGSVKTKCLHEGWQTSGSLKVVRMAFNLYCNSTPSVWDYEDAEEQVNECRQYTVEDIFCCAYAPYFWQAIQIRYPEYVVYNQKLHAMLGGIPKVLFTDEYFRNLSSDAKVLYGLMLDRMALSIRHQWFDEEGKVYIIFTVEQVIQYMNCGRDKAMKTLAELDTKKGIGLIERVKQGFGKPDIIYVKNFILRTSKDVKNNDESEESIQQNREVEEVDLSESEKSTYRGRKNRLQGVGKTDFKRSENTTYRGRKIRTTEVGKTDPNNTNYNYTDISNTDLINLSDSSEQQSMDLMEEMELFQMNTALVKRNIEYDCLVQRCRLGEQQQLDEIVALIVETISIERENITISGVKYPYQFVKSRLLLLEESHIEYVLDCLHENTREVKNIKAYLLTCLMNSITTIGNYYQAKVNHDMYGGDI